MVPTMNGGRLGATLKQNFVQLYVCILNGFLFHVSILFLFLNHECIFYVKKIKGRKERKKKGGGKAGRNRERKVLFFPPLNKRLAQVVC